MLGWEAPKENQAGARIALSSFIKITTVVFFIPSPRHSTLVSSAAHLQDAEVQKMGLHLYRLVPLAALRPLSVLCGLEKCVLCGLG